LGGKQSRRGVVERGMRIGVVFPQTELGGDPAVVRAYGQGVEELGFTHILAYDHVVGADPEVHRGWQGPYDIDTTFHEPFVMFGYLAAVTSLELVTGVIILPQRQSVLVAKQAAEVDLLTGGRFRLGIGLGWNAVEYEALGEKFTNRGRRSEEQVEVMRKLWTERSVTFNGKHHTVTGAGLAPMPIQRPIPVWFGAASDRAYERAGRLGDGWFPMMEPGPGLDYAREQVKRAAATAGRDADGLGMEGRVSWAGDRDKAAADIAAWKAAGATHLSVNTMGAGLATVDDHLAALERVAADLK
jgi:probable F420-dependent oxidoreductase